MTLPALRHLAATALCALAFLAAPAQATSVGFSGGLAWEVAGSTATLDADSISNYSGTESDALRLELWLFTSPYSGSGLGGYRVATYQFGTIEGAHTKTGVHGVVPFYGPPSANYYQTMVLTEYTGAGTNDGFTQRAYKNFPGAPIAFGPTSPPPPSSISPQVGLWWNPAESGSGYAFDFKHGILVVTVYSYKADGTPLWYIVSGPVTGNSFSGTLNRTTGGQCISCAYVAPTLAGNDGVMSIVFSSPSAGTMTLPGGRVIPIVPQAF